MDNRDLTILYKTLLVLLLSEQRSGLGSDELTQMVGRLRQRIDETNVGTDSLVMVDVLTLRAKDREIEQLRMLIEDLTVGPNAPQTGVLKRVVMTCDRFRHSAMESHRHWRVQKNQMVTRLQKFLYILIRDHVNLGALEGILENHVNKGPDQPCEFSNAFMAEYAMELVHRLLLVAGKVRTKRA